VGLTDGDFWARPAGVQLLHKGQDSNNINFGRIEAASNINNKNFELSSGQPLSLWLYVVRRVNCCGMEEQTLSAAVMVAFDSLGNLIGGL
jgi:hypothetical protein